MPLHDCRRPKQLAQALGVEVPERLRPEEGVGGSDDEMSSGASDESDSEGSAG